MNLNLYPTPLRLKATTHTHLECAACWQPVPSTAWVVQLVRPRCPPVPQIILSC